MKEYMQKMGRSLMLPVATLPVAALFTGIDIGLILQAGAPIMYWQPL